MLASGNDDGTIGSRDVADPAHPQPVGPPLTGGTEAVYSVAFGPDGHTLATGSIDGAIRLWNLNVDDAAEWICTTAGKSHAPAVANAHPRTGVPASVRAVSP